MWEAEVYIRMKSIILNYALLITNEDIKRFFQTKDVSLKSSSMLVMPGDLSKACIVTFAKYES